jgi:ribonuclease P protein component
LRGAHFDLHYLRVLKEGDVGTARLGLVVAKKFARNSVLRNLFKRIGREAFRHALPVLPGCDLVLRLSKPVPRTDRLARRVWRDEIDGLLARVRIELSR